MGNLILLSFSGRADGGKELIKRFDERLRRRLAKAAERNGRSMNAEIINRLEQSFHQEDRQGERQEIIAEVVKNAVALLEARRESEK